MLEALSAILGGGITGLAGSVISALIDLKKQAVANAHEEAMERLTQETLKIEWETRSKIAGREATSAEEVAAAKALSDSLTSDKATYAAGRTVSRWAANLLGVVDAVRGLTRPVLTLSLVAAMVWALKERPPYSNSGTTPRKSMRVSLTFFM